RARAFARSAAAEMHAGFPALRDECSMHVGLRIRLDVRSEALQREVRRLGELFAEGLARFGGPWLAGDRFGIADAMYAPVASRFRTYGIGLEGAAAEYLGRLFEHPAVQEWIRGGIRETAREPGHEEDCFREDRTVLEELHGDVGSLPVQISLQLGTAAPSFPPVAHVGAGQGRCGLQIPSFLIIHTLSSREIQPAKMACDYAFVKEHTPEGFEFPAHRLQCLSDSSRIPLVLVACGSFSPITYLHLRMFSMARDHARNEGFEVVAGYLSPVSDGYSKKGLAPARHRIEMCKLAAENTSKWLAVDPWEAESPTYIPTARVLDHFDYEINEVMGGVECPDGSRKRARVVLLAGLDLIQTMSTPGVWGERDLDHILGHHGVFALERTGTEIDSALTNLKQWEQNIYIIQQVVANDISSTKVRLLLKRHLSIDYLIPDDVINYIYEHNHRDFDLSSDSKGKDKASTAWLVRELERTMLSCNTTPRNLA
ncbi:hypothetical protein AK830_g6306, partial [Neonectria ditissima]